MSLIEKCQQWIVTSIGKRSLLALNLLLLFSLFFIIYAQLKPILQYRQQHQLTDGNSVADKKPASSQQLARDIAGEHLFGEAPAAATPTVIATNIAVLGLFLADNPKQSSAVLRIDNQPEQNFWPGDVLPGGGKLKEIQVDRVIITENGVRKVIYFNMDEFTGIPTIAQPRGDTTPRPSIGRDDDSGWRRTMRDRLRQQRSLRRQNNGNDSQNIERVVQPERNLSE